MLDVMTIIFNGGVNLALAFLVWGIVAACKKGLSELPKKKMFYFLISAIASPVISFLYLKKVGDFVLVDYGFVTIAVFVLANLYQKLFKEMAKKMGVNFLNKK